MKSRTIRYMAKPDTRRYLAKPYRLTTPPRALQRAKLDNLALVPANLLAFKAQWQQVANNLPKGSVLIILPETDQRLRKALDSVATLLEADGHPVTALSAEWFRYLLSAQTGSSEPRPQGRP